MLALLGLLLDLTGGGDRWSSKNLGGRGGLCKRSGLNVGPVEVLVLGVPLGRGLLVGATEFLVTLGLHVHLRKSFTYVECASLLHLLLLGSNWAHSPAPGVQVALHDDTLDLGNDAVIARCHLNSGHLCVGEGDGLTLGGHEDDFLVDLNALLETEKTGKHKLRTVADGVDGAVLHDNALVAGQKTLEGRDDSAEVRLVAVVVVDPLGVKNVVESDQALGLVHGTRPHTAQLLHVGTNTEQKTQVDAEGTDVGSSLAADPEDTELPLIVELVELALVDGSDTQLTLDGGDQRGTLEESTGQGLEGARELGLATGQLVVQTDDADILLTSSLLRLDEASSAVNADNQAASDLGIEGSRVTGLLNAATTLAFPLPLSE
jgi:hypothetical protein